MATTSRKNKKRISKYLKYKSNIFYSLAPVESDNYDKYNDAFKFALNHNGKSKKITNIAVTGPYASGKSSVIEKVKEEFGDDKFITLSLTNFNSGDMESDNKIQENSITNKKIEEDLEAQLINQLIHKIDSKKIEDSRFLANKKIDTSKLSYKVGTFIHALIISIIFLCLIIVNINNETISKILFLKLDDIKITSINILFIVGSIYSLYFGYKIINLFKKKKILRKINIYGNEIELFTNEDNSIFDKYTDEILYLFKNAGVKYFIFEDIDRYEDVTIFKKLREINILLNETLKREKKSPIKFIYLICDNMFTAEERTKFFDFIIPVVPYIHKGNAYDYMAELFADEIKDERNKKFLIKVSLFIDNSRLLKNIANEYYTYNKFITLPDREPHTKFIKLLSLIIYKNLFPKDFNQLYFNKGYLAELFNKEEFVKMAQYSDFINEVVDNECENMNYGIGEYDFNTYKQHLKKHNITEILEKLNNKECFFKAPKGYDYIYNGGYFNLIKFLVLDKYIDETYKDYMSAITENSLTYEERAFLQNIIAHNGKQYKLSLSQIYEKYRLNNLLTFLDEEYFNQIEILNIYLLNSLISNDSKIYFIENISSEAKAIYKYWIELYIKKIQENKWYEFLFIYIESFNYNLHKLDMEQTIILNTIYNNYNDIANIASQDEKVYIKFAYFTINSLICFNDIYTKNVMIIWNNIKQNKDNIKNYIQNNTKFIKLLDTYYSGEDYLFEENDLTKISHNDIYNFINVLSECNIKFNDIREIHNIDFYNSILDKHIFIVTYDNVIDIIKYIYKDVEIKNADIILKSILEMENNTLQLYIFEYFDTFIQTFPNEKQPIIIEDDIYKNIISNNNISEKAKNNFKDIFFKRSNVKHIFK